MNMKKILLLGNPNEIIKSLYKCLINDFHLQLCFGDLETIKTIDKIIDPDMILVNQIETEEMDPAVLDWLKSLPDNLPVLFITSEERWMQCKDSLTGGDFERLFRPVTKDDLLRKCYQMLQIKPADLQDTPSHTRSKVMIVDDNPLVLRNLKTLLSDKYVISLATSGEQALSMISKKQPDLILLDYEMPGWDGKKTYEMFKAQEDLKDIPVIFLTSVSDRAHIAAILETKPADYILKPPDQDRLLQSIEKALGKDINLL